MEKHEATISYRSTIYELEEMAVDELEEDIERDELTTEEAEDRIHEIADSCTPVYFSDCLGLYVENGHLLDSNADLADGQGLTIEERIQRMIYEHLYQHLSNHLENATTDTREEGQDVEG